MAEHDLVWLDAGAPADAFPDVATALRDPDGLLAVGGDLGTERLLAAYVRGIFPWYEQGQPILWWSPDPRCVLWPSDFHLARRLARKLRTSTWTLSWGSDFDAVVAGCAAPRRSGPETWITAQMQAAYSRLHREGWAQSVEVRDGGRLVGGIYGVCIGRVFFGESMFSAEPNASKVAMLGLTRHMLAHGIDMLDCQMVSPHLLTLGATTISRPAFAKRLRAACASTTRHANWPDQDIPVTALLKKP